MTETMNRSSFQKIADDVGAVMMKEREAPTIVSPVMKNVAGFLIPDPDATKAAVASTQKSFVNYDVDETRVRADLSKAGVTPLAVLPSKAWKKICEKSDLIQIAPRDGKIAIKTLTLNSMVNHTREVMEGTGIVLCVLTTFAIPYSKIMTAAWSGYWGHQSSDFWFPMIVGALFCGVISALLSAIICGVFNGAWSRLFHRISMWYHMSFNWSSTLKQIINTVGSYDKRAVVLPTPPDDVIAILTKLAMFDLDVAAVPGAIRVLGLERDLNRNFEDEMRRRVEARQDPIVYLESGSAVAIIAQFGDFPIEKEIVAKLKAENIQNLLP